MRGQHPIFKTPPLFVFDLDSTITKCELLPFLAAPLGKAEEMAALTEQAMGENAGFAQNFADRVSLLISQPVSRLRRMAADVPLHTHIVDFICEARERCLIVTGNLDAWIDSLIVTAANAWAMLLLAGARSQRPHSKHLPYPR